MYQTQENSRSPKLDEQGQMIPRTEYYLGGVHCTPFSFPMAARRCTERYGAIGHDDAVTMHHFIIAFDRRDMSEYNLDGEMAQELVTEWVRRCLPGFICLIGTHTEGAREDPNIHCHVILNSVRLKEEPSAMKHPITVKEGHRFRTNSVQFQEMKEIMTDIMREHHLRHSERGVRSGKRVSDRERLVQRNGQENLEKTNRRIRQAGGIVMETEFLTEKEKIRRAVDAGVLECTEEDELRENLHREHGITVWEKNGIWQYRREETGLGFSCNSLGKQYWGIIIRERLECRAAGMPDPYAPKTEEREEDYPVSREDVSRVLEQFQLQNAGELRSHMEDLKEQQKTCRSLTPKYRARYADAFRRFCARRNELRRRRDPRKTEPPISWKEYHEEMLKALKERLHAKEESETLRIEAEEIGRGLDYLEEVLPLLPEYTEPEITERHSHQWIPDRDDR